MLFLYGTKNLAVTPQLGSFSSIELGKELQGQEITDLCFLETCHRFECYWYSEDLSSVDWVKRIILNNNHPGAEKFYLKFGPAVIEHLFRVSSGLDTLVLGEYEILGQIRHSLKVAQNQGFIGKFIATLFKEALLIGKKVRRETKIACGRLAYTSIVMEYISKINFPDGAPKVLMIGSGKLARQIGTLLDKHGFQLHIVAGRDQIKAQTLASDMHGGWSKAYELTELLPRFELVIGASGAKQPLITAGTLNGVQRSLTIIDLSVPSIVQSEGVLNPLVQIVGFEQISSLCRNNLEKRIDEVEKVELIIAAAVENTLITNKQRQKRIHIESVKKALLHEGKSLLTGVLASIDDVNLKENVAQLWNQQLQKIIHLSIENEKQENLRIKEEVGGFFPIILSLKDQRILVIGGGKVAGRKIKKMLEANAKIEVVAPCLTSELEALALDGKINWKKRFYQTELLESATIVIAATDDIGLNRKIAAEARQKRILVNTVNQAEDSDFIFPAQIRRGDLLIAVSTSGKQPALAREIREELELLFQLNDDILTCEKEMKI